MLDYKDQNTNAPDEINIPSNLCHLSHGKDWLKEDFNFLKPFI